MFGSPHQQSSVTSAVSSPVSSSLSQTATHFFNTISNSSGQQQVAFGSPATTTTTTNGFFSSSNNESLQHQQEVQFAPSFLFGNQQHSNRRSFATPTRPAGYGSPGILKNREGVSTSGKSVHWSPVLVRERSKSPDNEKKFPGSRFGQHTAPNKPMTNSSLWNGPPLRSLNDDVFGPPEKITRLEQQAAENASSSSSRPEVWQREPEVEVIIPDEENSDDENIYWVTVFGFGDDQLDQILELFSRHGDIMAHKVPKNGCNWVNIRYSSPIHARQALAKNASLFQGHMIGVVPCKDREALEDESAAQNRTPVIPKQQQPANRSMNGSPSSLLMDDSSFMLNGSRMVPSVRNTSNTFPSRARLSISSRTGMRPLNVSAVSDKDRSMDSSLQGGTTSGGGGDDSFVGKLWSFISAATTGTGASNGT